MASHLARRAFASAAGAAHDGGSAKLWRNLSLFIGVPACGVCVLNSYLIRRNHSHERPEFVPYPHLRIRNKRFPWGDGNHSLFHNKHSNPLPDGYED